jgi:catechol 2,3-dioxygenase-like lactoylglutathione lyase family enzyme
LSSTAALSVGEGELHLEVAIIPVSDVDRSKQFYERLGWRLDEDVAPMDGLRIVQFTPPGSGCSITFGIGVTTAAPGSAASTLTTSDIVSTHKERAIQRGARRINGVPARTDRAGCRSPGAIQRPRRHPVQAEVGSGVGCTGWSLDKDPKSGPRWPSCARKPIGDGDDTDPARDF